MQRLPTRIKLVFLGKQAYIIAAQGRSSQELRWAAHEVNNAFKSSRDLNDAERKLAQPLTLRVATAAKGASFAEPGRSSPLGKNAVSHWRLINWMYTSGERADGYALKVIE